ncbi:MAG TPA: FHA domain-containing protein [Candidatus Coprenecus pullistercoris]|nr:FHA domain-containing protein [Candidatus Coprenecus pullistercoris]
MANTKIMTNPDFEANNGSRQYSGNVPGADSKQVMGFLYSVSRTQAGEFWPLHVGPNRIGRSAQCEISLSEASVSENHATLVIRKMHNNGQNAGVFVFIQDTGSMYGTMLNGVTLDFSPKECKSGDIISIGENYELYFVLIDSEALGLKIKPGFKSTVVKPEEDSWPVGVPKGTIPAAMSPFDDNSKKTVLVPPQR